jgi:hypothetical protein
MLRLVIFVIAICCTKAASAAGWHDYELPIDPDFKIVRANELDVVLCHHDRTVLAPRSHVGVGPICAYAVTPTYIFSRHYGRSPRNLFAGDTYENVDMTRHFFFVTIKSGADVQGPFDEQAFLNHSAVKAVAPIQWIEPKNPNIAAPLLGSFYFLAVSVLVLGWPVLVVVVAVVAISIAVRRLLCRSRGD